MMRRLWHWLVTWPRILWERRVEVARRRLSDDGIEAVRARVRRLNTEVEIIERRARGAY